MSAPPRRLKWPCPICGAELDPQGSQAVCPRWTVTCRPHVLHQATVEEGE